MGLTRIRQLSGGLVLITDSQEVAAVTASLPEVCRSEGYTGYLVEVCDGEFVEVWGFYGIVPYLDCIVYPCELEV